VLALVGADGKLILTPPANPEPDRTAVSKALPKALSPTPLRTPDPVISLLVPKTLLINLVGPVTPNGT
jgi:hypothetical protein